MSDEKTEWMFEDHQGRPLPVWASNEREAVNEANRIAKERDAETITLADIQKIFTTLYGGSLADARLNQYRQRMQDEHPAYSGKSGNTGYDSNSISWEGNGQPAASIQRNGTPTTAAKPAQKRGLTCAEAIIIVFVIAILIGFMAIRG